VPHPTPSPVALPGPRRRGRLALLSALAASFVLGGCFSYRPAEVSQVEPSSRIRVSLADQEFPRLRAYLDARQGTVSGEFVGYESDSLTMVVETPISFQEISIARSSVLQVEQREVNQLRSVLISAGIIGGVGLLAYLGFDGRGGELARPGPQPEDSWLPLFSVGLPFR